MSNTPAAKRRRVEAANATLRQPFRSPVVKAPAKGASGAGAGSAGSKGNPTAASVGIPSRKGDITPRRATHQNPTPEASSTKGEPTFVWTSRRDEFEEKNAALEREIARLREEESRDSKESETRDELDELIVKWRGAAQIAAEELFEASRSRVESMGGMKELAAMRRRQAEFFHEEIRKGASRGPDSDEDSGREELDDEEEGRNEEEEYTMATMLRSLNIEPDVIGYDTTEECWK